MAKQGRGKDVYFMYWVLFFFVNVFNVSAQYSKESRENYAVELYGRRGPYGFRSQGMGFGSPSTSLKRCDLSQGTWKKTERQVYNYTHCPYLNPKSNCKMLGRLDDEYLMWKWKPNECNLPYFNGWRFLEALRGKRMLLVGDSIMKNQWDSLVCLIQSTAPKQGIYITGDNPWSFHITSLNVSAGFQWAPVLVELVSIKGKRYLNLERIEENAKHWRNVDVLVFDSAHWWDHDADHYQWDYVVLRGKRFDNDKIGPSVAYYHALQTWSNWVEKNLNPTRTKIIFRTEAARHNGLDGSGCRNRKTPNLKMKPHIQKQKNVVEHVLGNMNFPVYLLDITSMSAARRDGHPSSKSRVDCSHWCLPGVPDTWNEMLSALLV